eukprot:scaffold73403_cov62-Phaeocystis_antarctica.AAC.2
MKDVMTRDAAERLVSNLRKVGQREEAEALADKHGLADKKCVWRLRKLFGSAADQVNRKSKEYHIVCIAPSRPGRTEENAPVEDAGR